MTTPALRATPPFQGGEFLHSRGLYVQRLKEGNPPTPLLEKEGWPKAGVVINFSD
jgi:hypothetical protein